MTSKLGIRYVPFENPGSSFSGFSTPTTTATTDNLAAKLRAGMVMAAASSVAVAPLTPQPHLARVLTAAEQRANSEIAALLQSEGEEDDESLEPVRALWR